MSGRSVGYGCQPMAHPMPTTTNEDEVLDQLRAFLVNQLGEDDAPEVDSLKKASLGRSRENWLFDAVWRTGSTEVREPLIVRRDPLGGLVESERATEFAILRALEACSLPTPKVKWLDATGEWLGRPSLIMHRESGESDYYILNGDRPLETRLAVAESLCDLLAAVHLVDWRTLGLGEVLSDPGERASTFELDRLVETLHDDQLESYPELEFAIVWFREHAPRSQATVLVHSDFKAGNVLLDGTDVVALLDWELAHLGDPLEDLGWVTQPLREREHLIPGSWEREQLIERYREATGFEVGDGDLRWWNAFSTFKTAVMQVSGLRSYLEGRSQEPYRPTARVLRTLLEAIEP
jgi:aminoglycoside phosphotransferase (APT) family kinase protein